MRNGDKIIRTMEQNGVIIIRIMRRNVGIGITGGRIYVKMILWRGINVGYRHKILYSVVVHNQNHIGNKDEGNIVHAGGVMSITNGVYVTETNILA